MGVRPGYGRAVCPGYGVPSDTSARGRSEWACGHRAAAVGMEASVEDPRDAQRSAQTSRDIVE